MAVLQMQRMTIYGIKIEQKKVVEMLQRQEVIELKEESLEDSIFYKEDFSKYQNSAEKYRLIGKEAEEILQAYFPEKKTLASSIRGRSSLTVGEYNDFKKQYEDAIEVAEKIIQLNKEINKLKAEEVKLIGQKEQLSPWQGLDIPISFKETKYTTVFIGTFGKELTVAIIEEMLQGVDVPYVEIISSCKEQTCSVIVVRKCVENEVLEILRGNGFSYPDAILNEIPKEQLKEIEEKIKENEANIRKSEEQLACHKGYRRTLRLLQDYESIQYEKYGGMNLLAQSHYLFILTGYIPENKSMVLEKKLHQHFTIAMETEVPDAEEEVPIVLKNNALATPLEPIVEAFSLPGKQEVDPTGTVAIFYYFLFGLMLSDAAYGLLIAAACGIVLWKFKGDLEDGLKNTLKMFFFCGLSTIFWGILFGSYFGDLVDVVSETFMGRKVMINPLWFFPVKEPMRMLVFSMLLGCIHLFTGLGLKLYQYSKQKDYQAILYDVVLWFGLLVSSIVLLLSMEVFINTVGISFILSPQVGKIAGIIAIGCSIGIVLTNGRESRNPFKRFLKGAYALYGITGYLSDVLSYSRLLALGLATGVICSVINKMAAMTAGMPGGVVWFILILVLGHSLNIAINALGAYVHTNRLQYVEFFGKFYEGGGRKFKPFGLNTKYFKLREDMENE